CLARADREILLDFPALVTAKGRIGEHHVVAVFVLNVCEVLGKTVRVDDVGRLDSVKDHVHDRDHVGERLLLLTVERECLACHEVSGGEVLLRPEVIEGLTEEAGRSARGVVYTLADLGIYYLDYGPNERAGSVVLSSVPPCVAHPLYFFFIENRQLVFLILRTE